jgi:ABC-type sugar transport system ATPase subunit
MSGRGAEEGKLVGELTPEQARVYFGERKPIVEMKGICKYFGHVRALHDVDFEIYPDEIVALLGDNGAGKSTLIKILSGAYAQDRGEVYIDGQLVTMNNPHHARQLGISTVYQDLALVDERDIACNVFLGSEPSRGVTVDKDRMNNDSAAIFDDLHMRVPGMSTVTRLLSRGQRQAVAIGRATALGGRVIIMDEPTAAQGIQDARRVLDLILRLKEQGSSVVVISHNMLHVFSVADRIVVLRGGQRVGSVIKQDTSGEEVVKLIVGES